MKGDTNQSQMSFDDEAAQMADQMLAKGGGGAMGDMPAGQRQAEGGFVGDAGGDLMSDQRGRETGEKTEKSDRRTGTEMNNEPGRDKGDPRIGTEMNNEPGPESGTSGMSGNLPENKVDEEARKRKPGRVGVGGPIVGKQNITENADAETRGRKAGKVGIAKGEDEDSEKACGMKKGNGEEDEDREEEDDAEKSEIAPDDLLKSLDTLESIAAGQAIPSPQDRRAELAEGFVAGTLSKSEIVELHDLTKSDPEPEPEPEQDAQDGDALEKSDSDSYQDAFAADPTMAEGYDVSAFLERQSQLLAASLDDMSSRMTKSFVAGQEHSRAFNRALAKSLRGMAQLSRDQSDLIKSLSERLETVENQPMPRRGHSSVRTLNKSMPDEVGGGAGGQGPTRTQVFDELEGMAKSMDYSQSGIKVTDAVAQFESSGQIPASLMREIQQRIANRASGVR
jgi:hypothetical protein